MSSQKKSPRLARGLSGALLLRFRNLLRSRLAVFGILPAEALNPARRVDHLLLTCEKRMAVRANFHVNLALVRGPSGEGVTACT